MASEVGYTWGLEQGPFEHINLIEFKKKSTTGISEVILFVVIAKGNRE